MAWTVRWIQDDAYITFVYSRNLARGLGPVWNPGYVVEGYTNFLWMLLLAGAEGLGFPSPHACHVLSLACFAASLALVFVLGRLLFRDDRWALLAVALVGTNYSFLKYATGGLETQLQTTLTLAALLLVARIADDRRLGFGRLAVLSIVWALAAMNRPDGAVLVATTGAVVLYHLARAPLSAGRKGALLAALAAPASLIVLPWLAWKLRFYGHLVPNTALIKLGVYRLKTPLRGLAYVAWPFVTYAWLPILAAVALRLGKRVWPLRGAAFPLVLHGAAWSAYVVYIGGDLMEFRHLICIFPLFILALVGGVKEAWGKPAFAAIASSVMLTASVVHGHFFRYYVRPAGIGNIPEMSQLTDWWRDIGEQLRADLGTDSGVRIAVSPAGAIPYCSGLQSIDILGLNDLWVARHGYVRKNCDVCLGHMRSATIDYLESAGANLVIGHPQEPRLEPRTPDEIFRAMFFDAQLDYDRAPPGTRLLRIPVGAQRSVYAIYLEKNQAIDSLIARGAWSEEPLRRD